MRAWKRIAAILYLLASLVVCGGFACLFSGSYRVRAVQLLSHFGLRVAAVVCLVVVAAYSIFVVLHAFFKRPDPVCVHPDGNPDIQITKGALISVASVAAEDTDALIEGITIKIKGRDRAVAEVLIEAIALTDHDAKAIAERIQARVKRACDDLLGTTSVIVKVRFLPSKTETMIKEASGE